MSPRHYLLEGPSLLAPFAAAVLEAQVPDTELSLPELHGRLQKFLPPALRECLRLPLADAAFEAVIAALALAVQDLHGPMHLAARTDRPAAGVCRVGVGYAEPEAAALALDMAFDIAQALFAPEKADVDSAAISLKLQRIAARLRKLQPDPLARALMRVARRRGIPVACVAPESRVWLYGQGSRGVHLFEAGSHFDAMTGSRLARRKQHANQLVTRLGLPGVVHRIADSARAARRIAGELGYPVVVKPAAGAKGAGVNAWVTSDAELVETFNDAQRQGRGDVLVERHVPGEDHRLVVIGGQFAWAVRRSPPQVLGDGARTIAELMDAENRRRAGLAGTDLTVTKLGLDDEVLAVLASQGLTPGDRPAAGTRVLLRRIANVARGGTLADCTAQVHPDVRDMVEAIARSIHLDTVGIDFMTPDITRSWREVDCAVLEVNATPGFSSDERAELILDTRFPAGSDGRVPAIVLVDADRAALDRVAGVLAQAGLRVGSTDANATALDGHPRVRSPAPLPARVTALVMDAGCDALAIGVTAAEIERHGFPVGRCRLALLGGAALAGPLQELVASCADRLAPLGDGASIAALVAEAIAGGKPVAATA